ncbi:MAG: integrin alpha [Planctomycetaceae bacterium]
MLSLNFLRQKPNTIQRSRHRFDNIRIESLEVREYLSATNPLALTSLDGSNGVVLVGNRPETGLSVDGAGDINGDGFDDVIVGSPRFQVDGVGAGAAFVVFGRPDGFSAAIDLSTLDGQDGFRIDGANAWDYFGHSVSSAGDVNADGFDDLLVGAYEFTSDANDPEPIAGEAFVVFGRSTFASTLDVTNLNGSNGFKLEGDTEGDFFGESVSFAGDLNGDGYSDVVVGAWRSSGGSGRGDTFVVFGKQGGFSAVVNMSSLNGTDGFRINGTDAGNFAGDSVSSAGDINGDGFDDLMIGVTNGDPTGQANHDHGQTFILFGQAATFPATMTLSDFNGTNGFQVNGIDIGDTAGERVSSAGDVNGDGIDDLIIGARRAEPGENTGTGEGKSYVVFGRTAGFGTSLNLRDLDGSNGFRLSGLDPGDGLGDAVGRLGDVNGDGFDDVIVGAQHAEAEGMDNGTITGESYVVFGKATPFAADLRVDGLNGTNGFRIDGIAAGNQIGHSVRGAGDVNGDGFDDIIVGTYGTDDSYIIFGGNFTGGSETQVGANGNNTLTATQGANGIDILVGGRDHDTLISDGGDDVLRGGEGDDILAMPDVSFSGTRRLVGGNGTDTLRLDGKNLTLNLTSIADNRIVDIEVIDLTVNGANTLILDVQDVLNISSHSNTLTVLNSGAEAVDIGSGWIQQADEVSQELTFEVFTQAAATVKIQKAAGPLDIDGDGSVDAATDGVLSLRYLFGFRNDALIANVIGTGAVNTTAAQVETALADSAQMLDADGDGTQNAATDGILILRHLFGFSGNALVAGAVGTGAIRTTGPQVAAWLNVFLTRSASVGGSSSVGGSDSGAAGGTGSTTSANQSVADTVGTNSEVAPEHSGAQSVAPEISPQENIPETASVHRPASLTDDDDKDLFTVSVESEQPIIFPNEDDDAAAFDQPFERVDWLSIL